MIRTTREGCIVQQFIRRSKDGNVGFLEQYLVPVPPRRGLEVIEAGVSGVVGRTEGARRETLSEEVETPPILSVEPVLRRVGVPEGGGVWVHEERVGREVVPMVDVDIVTGVLRGPGGQVPVLVKEGPDTSSLEGDGLGLTSP